MRARPKQIEATHYGSQIASGLGWYQMKSCQSMHIFIVKRWALDDRQAALDAIRCEKKSMLAALLRCHDSVGRNKLIDLMLSAARVDHQPTTAPCCRWLQPSNQPTLSTGDARIWGQSLARNTASTINTHAALLSNAHAAGRRKTKGRIRTQADGSMGGCARRINRASCIIKCQ
jgi:hypothetical protein